MTFMRKDTPFYGFVNSLGCNFKPMKTFQT